MDSCEELWTWLYGEQSTGFSPTAIYIVRSLWHHMMVMMTPGPTKNLSLLSHYNLADWPAGNHSGGSLNAYKLYVQAELEASHFACWASAAKRHRAPVPYRRIMPSSSNAVRLAISWNLPWNIMCKQLSMCRLRCGLVPLGHLSRKKSYARVQQCMSCDAMVSNPWVHVFGECHVWRHMREPTCRALGISDSSRSWDKMYGILGVQPESDAYSHCLEFVNQVVVDAGKFRFNNKAAD